MKQRAGRLRKTEPIDLDYLASVESGLGEWSSEADDRAYDEL